jgi:hypothetical protein
MLTRPRGYIDPERDRIIFDRRQPPPGRAAGRGVSSSRLQSWNGPHRAGGVQRREAGGRDLAAGEHEVTVLD